ncbi:hypothetical protein GRJ2_003094900 [Grus japonensis]|uniref:Uncharacterized protein n=1 Tax=Grus japonensis TaxID=30415 RepID=A0ABC9Y8I0_GRUJA
MLSMHFSTGLFYKDTARQQEAVTLDGISNHRFKQSSALMAQGRRIELLGSIHSNLFFQDKHLLNDMNIKIKLMHCKDSFCFMSSPAAGACKLVITYTSLFVKKVRVAPGVCLRHAEALIMANINYWMDWVHMKVFSILAISRASNQENLFLGQLPKLVVIGFIDNDTFSGSYAKNPFNFKRYDVNFVALYVDGCFEFAWQGFGRGGGYRGGFCEKLLEASPLSDRANASRLQDGPTAGQGQGTQQWW